MRIVTADEMRELEQRAVSEFEIESLDLMERAAEGIVRAVGGLNPEDTQILVLCGPGNNGGDGMAAARLLESKGCIVTTLLATEASALKGDALAQYRRLAETEVRLYNVGTRGYERTLEQIDNFDIIVDALLGTGSRGGPQGEVARLVEITNEAVAFVVAADIPTGVDCDTGMAAGVYVSAAVTATFGLPKPFLFQNEGLEAAGDWHVVDIGLPDELVADAGSAFLLDHWWASGSFPIRTQESNKRTSGVVLVVAGSERYPGALTLACNGALRAGAGLVKAASIRWACEGLRNHIPECPIVILSERDGTIYKDAIDAVIEAAADCDAVAIGPGLGRTEVVGDFIEQLWEQLETRWVVDADAIFWMAERAIAPKGPSVLTPHEGEAARLMGIKPEEVRANRMAAASSLAKKYSQAVVLKGAYTVIASEEYDGAINPTGNPGLATGGTGDVQTGVTAALLSAGLAPKAAGALGAFWHGAAADLVADHNGDFYGMTATDVAEALPEARALIESGELGQPMGETEEWNGDELDEIEQLENL